MSTPATPIDNYLSALIGNDVQSIAAGGLPSTSIVDLARMAYPWIYPPPNFEPFDPIVAIPTPAVNALLDTPVVDFTIPSGYSGVVRAVSCNYTGNSLVQGSGALIWRFKVDLKPVKNYGNILAEMGTIQVARPTFGIVLKPGQRFQITVTNVSAIALGTNIICSSTGYMWPLDQRIAQIW